MISFIFSLLLVSLAQGDSPQWPTVDLGYNVQQASPSRSTDQFFTFSNIRYAQPPVDDLRFAAPLPAKQDRTVQVGDEDRVCLQASGSLGPGETEDCLFLDVVVPKHVFNNRNNGSGAPVLVWIYGGGYVGGNKIQFPAGLLTRADSGPGDGLVFVALNYRLGALGWLSGPSFQANGTPNAGLLDQRLALEWVQAFIHSFGGDPSRVTVMGESAGGGSVVHQITAYGGAQPVRFQRAIPQSGAWTPMPDKDEQGQLFQRFLKVANVGSLQEARKLSSAAIRQANQDVVAQVPFGQPNFGPAVDSNLVPDLPGKLLLQGAYAKNVDVMVSHNAREGEDFAPSTINDDASLAAFFGGLLPHAATTSTLSFITESLYPPTFDGSKGYTNQRDRAVLAVSEALFNCNTNYFNRAFGGSYKYLFSVNEAKHGEDIAYTFFSSSNPSVVNDNLATAMQSYITSFAATGNPNTPGLPNFPTYANGGEVMKITAGGIGLAPDPAANDRCLWWQQAFYA